MGLIVPQHSEEQRLADATAPVRGIDKHVRAPASADSVDAAHTPNNVSSVDCHILAE